MDEFDAPRKMPVENFDGVPQLEELQRQTCKLFEEFLLLDDPICRILDEPLPASYNDLKEEADDSPVEKFYKANNTAISRSRGIGFYGGDDAVPDSPPVMLQAESAALYPQGRSSPPSSTPVQATEQEEKEEFEKDDKMKKLAFELAKAGDALVADYGENVQSVEGKLIQLVKQEAADLTYERFSTAIDTLVGQDKNWTNFVFAFCVGRRICKHSKEVFDYTRSHFYQYVQTYSETIQQSGDMETFVLQRSPMPQ